MTIYALGCSDDANYANEKKCVDGLTSPFAIVMQWEKIKSEEDQRHVLSSIVRINVTYLSEYLHHLITILHSDAATMIALVELTHYKSPKIDKRWSNVHECEGTSLMVFQEFVTYFYFQAFLHNSIWEITEILSQLIINCGLQKIIDLINQRLIGMWINPLTPPSLVHEKEAKSILITKKFILIKLLRFYIKWWTNK